MALVDVVKDWLGTFWRILIYPTPDTFVDEAEKAKDKLGSAIGWVIFVIIYSYLMAVISGYVFNMTTLVIASLILPLTVIMVPSATHFILQRFFHRKQYLYDKILYIYTAIFVLFQLIVNPIIFFFPTDITSIINYLIIVYQIILLIIATKSIANIKYWQAVITIMVSLFTGMIIFICAIPFITSLMGGVAQTLR